MSVYAALLARPGARALALACAAGGMSFAGLVLAVVLLVEDATGSFALAGLCVGGLAAGAGLLAPVRGRLVDRSGGPALVWFGALHTSAIVGLLVAAGRAPEWAVLAAAVAAGATAPPLMASARSVWPRVSGPDLARAGHATNALIGDLAAVLSPAAVGLLAALAGPRAALALIGGGPLVGALVVARLGMGAPIGVDRARQSARGALALPGLRTMVAAGLPLGVALGALEVGAPALAGAAGSPSLAAVPLAAFAAGSVAGSLWAGQSGRAGTPRRRFVAGTVVMAAALAPCALVGSVAALAGVLVLAGVGFALVNVGALELLDEVVPARNGVEALTWLTSAEGVGLAAGAAAAGALVGQGPGAALALVALAPLAVAGIALSRRETLGAGVP